MIDPGIPELETVGSPACWVVGVIALFKINNEDAARSLAYQLASLSSHPVGLKFSKMGESIPVTPETDETVSGKSWSDLRFSFQDRLNWDKAFVILYLETKTVDDKDAYAFVNVRADRIEPFLRRFNEPGPYKLMDYTTIITQNYDRPSGSDWQKMAADYLFEPGVVNVRLFPESPDKAASA